MWAFHYLPRALFCCPIDLTINVVSLFAFIITLGLVVDDAIIVGENIYAKRESGQNWRRAIAGAQEMAVPVTLLFWQCPFAPMLLYRVWRQIFFMICGRHHGIDSLVGGVILYFAGSLGS